jgi:hypothetical protein
MIRRKLTMSGVAMLAVGIGGVMVPSRAHAAVAVSPAAHIVLTIDPTHLSVDPLSGQNIAGFGVMVTDAQGVGVAGDTVVLHSTVANPQGVTFGAVGDDGNGAYSGGLSSGTSTGDENITATDGGITSNIVVLTQYGSPTHVALALDPTSIPADGRTTTTATVTVTDAGGNGVRGENVGLSGDAAQAAVGTGTDNADGTYTFLLTAPTLQGADVLTGDDIVSPTSTLHSSPATLTETEAAVERFVHSAYFTLLGHDVDPGGLTYWVNAIDTGTPRSALASALSTSADYRTRVIGGTGLNSFYEFYLGRASDLNGVDFWVGQMASGMTFEQVRLRFVGSPEYFIHHQSDPSTTIDALYMDVLGRPDTNDPGKAYWMANFNATTIAAQFLFSQEGRTHLVNGDYTLILNRVADTPGLSFWANQLLSGASDENIINLILGSQEYLDHDLTH